MRKLWISEVRGAKPQNCQIPRRGKQCHDVASLLTPPGVPQMQLAMTHAVTTKPTTWKKVPRHGKGKFCPINRFEGPAEFGCSFSHLSPILPWFTCKEIPPKPRYQPRDPKQVPKPEDPEKKKSFRAEALPARNPVCEVIPVSPKNTTSTSRSAVRSSSDQVSVWSLSSNT